MDLLVQVYLHKYMEIILSHISHCSYFQWVYIFCINFYLKEIEIHTHVGKLSGFKLVPQGAIAGFLDAIGGGGWGPVNTPLLLASHKIQPRYAIGTVSASEFL